jgi:type I restriction enzyme R subunit
MGLDDTVDGMTKIKRFKDEEFPKILVSVNMLDTGFDCPEVVNLVMARFTKSGILYQQMRGRGTRRADHIKKTNFSMFDFVGVTDFHGDEEDAPEGGFHIPSKPRENPKKPRSLLLLDIHDHIDPATRDWITLDEDGNEIRTPEGEARANTLGVRFEAWLLSHPEFDADQLRLLRMVGEQIKSNLWSDFALYRFVNPPFDAKGGIAYAERLFGGAEELEEIIDDLNRSVFRSGTGSSASDHGATHQAT